VFANLTDSVHLLDFFVFTQKQKISKGLAKAPGVRFFTRFATLRQAQGTPLRLSIPRREPLKQKRRKQCFRLFVL